MTLQAVSPGNDEAPVTAHPTSDFISTHAGYVDIRGHPVWHEVSSSGPPVVLLHAGFGGASSWSAQRPALTNAGFRVYAPEQRGHAHTPDIPGPLSYSAMAQDTIHYLDQIICAPTALVGWSDGAVVALLVAQRRPDLVARLVVIGQYFNSAGKIPDSRVMAFLHTPAAMNYLRQEYDLVSPDGPEHFPVVYRKMLELYGREPELDLTTFYQVTAPTLVLQGDRDAVTVAHSMEVARQLARGRVAVLPGSHALPVERPEVVNALLVSFLRGEMDVPVTATTGS